MIQFVYANGYRFPVSHDRQTGWLKAHMSGINGWGAVVGTSYEHLLSRVRKALASPRLFFDLKER